MQANRIPYADTGKFSGLVLDYIAQEPTLCSFFKNLPTTNGFVLQRKERANFSPSLRAVLVQQLKQQYTHLKLKAEELTQLDEHIDTLKNKNTFTVTTGHQLCLFTGPLYTIYKILHVIRLAKDLRQQFPEDHFVPVFWMATEDHDFAEVNHVHINDKKLVWETTSRDGVGRISVENIADVIAELQKLLPASTTSDKILADLKAAYNKKNNLAQATRTLIHTWFGHYGLIIVDGDDAELKKAMIPAFTKEITQNTAFKTVTETSKKLNEKYKVQVTAREINLFYLRDGFRSRIVNQDGNYQAIDTNFVWTKDEILTELENHPERFSPNVLLRPLYQETILPNLGYIGGGGEIAYWAQLKDMFTAFDVPFPIVLLRQSFLLESKSLARKREKLGFTIPQLFGNTHSLENEIVKHHRDFAKEMAPFKNRVEALFAEIEQLTDEIDESLNKNVRAQEKKTQNRVTQIEKKLIRAAKRKDHEGFSQLEAWQTALVPNGGLQERYDNIVWQLTQFGPNLWDDLYKAIDPLAFDFIVLTEE